MKKTAKYIVPIVTAVGASMFLFGPSAQASTGSLESAASPDSATASYCGLSAVGGSGDNTTWYYGNCTDNFDRIKATFPDGSSVSICYPALGGSILGVGGRPTITDLGLQNCG